MKAQRYALLGVAHCWIVDPEARRLECFSLREGACQATAAAEAPAQLDIPGLAGLTIDLGAIFISLSYRFALASPSNSNPGAVWSTFYSLRAEPRRLVTQHLGGAVGQGGGKLAKDDAAGIGGGHGGDSTARKGGV